MLAFNPLKACPMQMANKRKKMKFYFTFVMLLLFITKKCYLLMKNDVYQ